MKQFEPSDITLLADQVWFLNRADASLYCIDKESGACTRELTLENPRALVAGQYGDGCGGGRIFIVDGDAVKVYNPDDKSVMVLLEALDCPSGIDKQGCILHITQQGEAPVLTFDLSKMHAEALRFSL